MKHEASLEKVEQIRRPDCLTSEVRLASRKVVEHK